MDMNWLYKNLPSLLGKTEIDIFKNYYNSEHGDHCQDYIEQMKLSSKDDGKSSRLAKGSDKDFQERNYYPCLVQVTKSLLHATYNSEAYAIALQKRSFIYYTVKRFENCIIDLNLCLQAGYPIEKKPLLYITKAKCYGELGNLKNMLETINDCYNFMKKFPKIITEDLRAAYLKKIKALRKMYDLDLKGTKLVYPNLEAAEIKKPHPLHSNVSSSIQIKYNNTETEYIAARDIPCGEVLFIENAYSHGPSTAYSKTHDSFFCDNCMVEAKNCIPCRTCVKLLYCSENCRIKAWNDYHQWECDIIRTDYVPNEMILSLRTVIKAACSGIIKETVSKKTYKPGRPTDPYLKIYSLFVNIGYLRSNNFNELLECCWRSTIVLQFLKKSNFISHLMSNTLRNLPYDEVIYNIGGLLLKHLIHALQRSITVNRPSPALELLTESKEKLSLPCIRNEKFIAFCPMVSAVPYSCIPNTNIIFQGCTAEVKASKDIKAGERIYRPSQNNSPNVPHGDRKHILENNLLITCECESCLDIKKNCDIFDTFNCTACGRYAKFEDSKKEKPCVLRCLYCGFEGYGSVMRMYQNRFDLARESGDLQTKINFVSYLASKRNPHHSYIHEMYKDILQLRSRNEDTKEFMKALEIFKNCSEVRNNNKYSDSFHYLKDLIVICEAFFEFLHINKVKIKAKEGLELLNIFSQLIEEAKKISVVTFPSCLELFIPLEVYLRRFRILHVYLKVE